MERVLALQGLSEDPTEFECNSNLSNVCSTCSSGAGKSSCSNQCIEDEQLDW